MQIGTYLGSEPRGPGHGWHTYTRRLSEFLVCRLMLSLMPLVLLPMCSMLFIEEQRQPAEEVMEQARRGGQSRARAVYKRNGKKNGWPYITAQVHRVKTKQRSR
mgnify:CR=1 FL=1